VLPSTDGAVDDTKVGSSVLTNVVGATLDSATGATGSDGDFCDGPVFVPAAGDAGVVAPTGELPCDGLEKGLLVGRFQCSSTGEPPVGMETLSVTGAMGVLGSATEILGATWEPCGNAIGFKDIGDKGRDEP
jgi:hypothetical protein